MPGHDTPHVDPRTLDSLISVMVEILTTTNPVSEGDISLASCYRHSVKKLPQVWLIVPVHHHVFGRYLPGPPDRIMSNVFAHAEKVIVRYSEQCSIISADPTLHEPAFRFATFHLLSSPLHLGHEAFTSCDLGLVLKVTRAIHPSVLEQKSSRATIGVEVFAP